jgi:hypothetical protein
MALIGFLWFFAQLFMIAMAGVSLAGIAKPLRGDSSRRGAIAVFLSAIVPIPVMVVAIWVTLDFEQALMPIFIIFAGPPVCWMFAGLGCWVLGRIWNQERVAHTFLRRPVEYWGKVYFAVGIILALWQCLMALLANYGM